MIPPPAPSLLITAGDPCGIGPEVILKSLAAPPAPSCRLIVIGDLAVFERTARRLRRRLPTWTVMSAVGVLPARHTTLGFIDLAHPWTFEPGRSSVRAGRASLTYVDVAVGLLRRGAAQGLVTAPVTKWAVERARRGFQGHTEYLAKAFSTAEPVMMFASPTLRVVLLTRHVALRQVPSRVTPRLVRDTVRATLEGLRRDFGIRHPRLAVCGLNPHAGEAGLFGWEEQRVLLPVMREFSRKGVRLEGPVSADGFFADPSGYDAVLCWYHDQGLIPFKLLARNQGCQVTLGLPVVRTSPDHGSALDIAGGNRAHPGSMRYAIRLAASLVAKRGQTPIRRGLTPF